MSPPNIRRASIPDEDTGSKQIIDMLIEDIKELSTKNSTARDRLDAVADRVAQLEGQLKVGATMDDECRKSLEKITQKLDEHIKDEQQWQRSVDVQLGRMTSDLSVVKTATPTNGAAKRDKLLLMVLGAVLVGGGAGVQPIIEFFKALGAGH